MTLLLLQLADPSWAPSRGHSTAIVAGACGLHYVKQDGAAPGGSALIVSRLQAGKAAFSSVSLSYFLFLSHPNAGTVQLETLEMGIFAI